VTLARIVWIPQEGGGRRHAPVGPRYSTVAVFGNEGRDKGNWSLVIDFLPASHEDGVYAVSFLSDTAPRRLLRPGVRFTLVEGFMTVAKGVIVSE
jgi:hypothetical protein